MEKLFGNDNSPVPSGDPDRGALRGGIGNAPALADKIALHIAAAEKFSQEKDFKSADDQAWQALHCIGLRSLERLRMAAPAEIAESVDPDLRPLISKACTVIGISYGMIRDNYHLRAFHMLELAVALDPQNIHAAVNLGSRAMDLTEENLYNSYRNENIRASSDDIHAEFLRERDMALSELERILKDRYGITYEHRTGELEMPKLSAEDKIYAVWAMSDLSKIFLNLALWDAQQPDGSGGTFFFKCAEDCAKSVLQIMDLPREFEDAIPEINRLMGRDRGVFGPRTRSVSCAFELHASVSQLKGDFRGAEKWHEAAVKIDPGNSFSRSRLEWLRAHDGLHKVVAVFDVRRDEAAASKGIKQDPWERKTEEARSRFDSSLEGWLKQKASGLSAAQDPTEILSGFAAAVAAIRINGKEGRTQFLAKQAENTDRWWSEADTADGYLRLAAVMHVTSLLEADQDSSIKGASAVLLEKLEEIRAVYGPLTGLEDDAERIQGVFRSTADHIFGSKLFAK